jgi:hypothetical protein
MICSSLFPWYSADMMEVAWWWVKAWMCVVWWWRDKPAERGRLLEGSPWHSETSSSGAAPVHA